MPTCRIYAVSNRRSGFQWKWRQELPDGKTIESKKEFQLYYECVVDARRNGFQPDVRCT